MESIKDAQGFISKIPITLSRGFSVETLTGVSPPWKTKYPEGCSTTIRRVVRKVGLYVLEVVSPWRCSFQTSGLAYNIIIIHTNNQDCITLTYNLINHLCTKHIDIKYYFIHKWIGYSKIKLKYMFTKVVLANIFIKQIL